jgi:hypothetical protein
MTEVGTRKKIKHAQFSYYVPTTSTDMKTGKTRDRLSRRIARAGDWIQIPREEDVQAGEESGAFFTDEELNPVVADEDTESSSNGGVSDDDIADASAPSHDELVAWIRDERPNSATVVERAGDDPEMAQALIDAENEASGGDPRKSVVEPLERIAG